MIARLMPMMLASCMSEFPEYRKRASWVDHDFDSDGFTEQSRDCDDENLEIHPGADERCDGANTDEDCDGRVDDDDDVVLGLQPFFTDGDGDGHGDATHPVSACDATEGLVESEDDCDDADPDVGGPTEYWGDQDGDGYGDVDEFVSSCRVETNFGSVSNREDCDDQDAAINPETLWYGDTDGDTYGDPFLTTSGFSTTTGCEPGAGWVLNNSDCDDELIDVGSSCAWRDLSMSDDFACAVRGNGRVECWGNLYDGKLDPPEDIAFLDVDVCERPGMEEEDCVICGIQEEDRGLACWGAEGDLLTDVPSGAFKAVSVGTQHACALTLDGEIVCWGADDLDQVSGAPTGTGFIDVVAGENLSLAIDGGGAVHVWSNGPSFPNPLSLEDTPLPEICLETGTSHYSADCDAALVEEQLGGDTYVSLGLDTVRVCGLTVDGHVRCAGSASDLEKGGHEALEGITVESLAVGRYRTCGIAAGTGEITCGGYTSSFVRYPGQESGYTQFSASLVGYTDCALWADDAEGSYAIHCWGPNDSGEGVPPT